MTDIQCQVSSLWRMRMIAGVLAPTGPGSLANNEAIPSNAMFGIVGVDEGPQVHPDEIPQRPPGHAFDRRAHPPDGQVGGDHHHGVG